MLNMCIPIPSRLPPDLTPLAQTLIPASSDDPPPFSSPSSQGSPDRTGKHHDHSQMKQDSDHDDLDEALEDQQDCNGDRTAASELQLRSDDGLETVLEEPQSDADTENQSDQKEEEERSGLDSESVDRLVENALEEDGGDKMALQVIAYEAPDEARKEVVFGEPSPCRSLYTGVHKRSAPVARQTRIDPFSYSRASSNFDRLRLNSSSDFDDDDYDTGAHMHAPRPPPPVGAGLGNMGNTCFLNAVMQCFTHTVPLVQGLKLHDCGFPTHHNDGEFCVLSAVCDHVYHALTAPGGVIFPENLVNNLSYISSFFQRFQQEDAHEYLQCLLDKTDTCWSKCKVAANAVSSEGDSLVKQVFGGRLASQLYCCKCGSRSDTYEPLVDLSLEIEDADDLNGALKSFTKMEENEDEVTFMCEKCKEQVPLKKQLLIDQAPCVATLHLKRFKGDGYFVEKIDKALEYPLELDLKPYTVSAEDENVELKYELYAVIVHMGFSSTSGHYLCYIRSSPDRWFRIDDSKITEVREDVALSQQGYILFYAKKGTPWPCSLVKSYCENGIWSTSPKSVLDTLEYTQHSNPQKACFYNPYAAEGSTAMEMEASTEHRLQQAVDETCTNTDEVASTVPKNEPNNEDLVAAGNTQHSNLQKACLYNQNVVEGRSVMEMEACTEPELLFQKVSDEACRNSEEFASNEPVDEVSSLAGVPRDNEAEMVGRSDTLDPMPTNDFSKKSMLVNETKLSIPALGVSNEHKVNGLKGNPNFSQASKSGSPGSGMHSEFENRLTPEASANPRPAKKVKVENSAAPKKANRLMTVHDRKWNEALKSMRRFPSHRRRVLAAYVGSRNGGSTSKIRRRL